MTKKKKKKILRELDKIKSALNPFFKNNPYSSIEKKEQKFRITKPWNDSSVVIELNNDNKKDLVNVLNKLVLPYRFTAIYHLDTKSLEFIYTILDKGDHLKNRKFK